MNLSLVTVPFDSAMHNTRMGVGPGHLIRSGLVSYLEANGHDVGVGEVMPPPESKLAEIRTAFELARGISREVRVALGSDRLPIILSGNCNSSIGTVAGVRGEVIAVFWFDSHGDYNTPDTTVGGFLDGMSLATLTGRCWKQLALSVDGFEAVAECDAVLLGVRDLDPLESDLLSASDVRALSPAAVRASLPDVLSGISQRGVRDAYVHLDLDVLDPSEGQANSFAVAGGLTVREVQDALLEIGRRFHIRAAGVTAFDPSYDTDGRVQRAAFELIGTIVEAAAGASAFYGITGNEGW
ncbi:MAG: arginase family protein [Gemmatimonadaceae bacterium]|nr:arginase family protein [Gemmatimonadaceae bacterium]